MSIQLVGWALDTPCGSPSRKAVLVALAHCHNHHTNDCFPSLKTIARETDLSVSTVQRAIEGLIEMGLIAKSERHRKNGSLTSNGYSFPTTPYGHGDHSPLVMVTTPEPEVRTGTRTKPSAAAPRTEPRISKPPGTLFPSKPSTPERTHPHRPTKERCDEIWDTLTDIFGPALTRTAEKHRGQLVQSLAGAGATRDEIMRRAKSWPAHFDRATLTAAALEKHWDTLGRKPLRRTG